MCRWACGNFEVKYSSGIICTTDLTVIGFADLDGKPAIWTKTFFVAIGMVSVSILRA
jgi:hypothetical protein